VAGIGPIKIQGLPGYLMQTRLKEPVPLAYFLSREITALFFQETNGCFPADFISQLF
jgi:hypothetical protein